MRDVGYGVGPATSIWPRISPPGKSPGPVFVGATPSLVCTLAYAPPVESAAIRSLSGWPASGPIRSAAVNVPCASTPSTRPPPGATGPKRNTTIGPFTRRRHVDVRHEHVVDVGRDQSVRDLRTIVTQLQLDLAGRSGIVGRHLVSAREMGDEVFRVGHASGLHTQRERAVGIGGRAAVAARIQTPQEQRGGADDGGT